MWIIFFFFYKVGKTTLEWEFLKATNFKHVVIDRGPVGYMTFDKGMITDNLARMLIMLAERYMKAGKWASYTYTDDMISSAITHMVGVCLKFDEMRSNNPFSFLSQCTGNVYKLILGTEKTQRMIRSQMLQDMGFDAPPNEAYENENTVKL